MPCCNSDRRVGVSFQKLLMQGVSISALLRDARSQTRLFLRQELELVKSEASEKATHYGAAAKQVGLGAGVAYAAFLVLLGGLGLLSSFVLQSIGLDLLPSRSAGFGGIGLVTLFIGVIVVFKAMKSLGKEKLTPQKTLSTIQRYNVKPSEQPASQAPPVRRKSKDVQSDVVATQQRLATNAQALVQRLSPAHYFGMIARRARAHPVRWNLGALAAGFVGSVWFVKKLKR